MEFVIELEFDVLIYTIIFMFNCYKEVANYVYEKFNVGISWLLLKGEYSLQF